MDNDAHSIDGSSRLHVDLDALADNFRTIAEHVSPARCGAVVKCDAYGLGIAPVASALYDAGCRTFFVAQLCEAPPLARAVGPGCTILILNGLDPGAEPLCARDGFVPALNTPAQIARWRELARTTGRPLPAALQIDSGMSRLGLPPTEAMALAASPALAAEIDLKLIFTHLACADTSADPANRAQLDRFLEVCRYFSGVPASIANSSGALLSPDFHLDLARPGIALLGAEPAPTAIALRPVVRLDARILQVHSIEKGTGVGYGLDHIAAGQQHIATIAVGYGDGWPRSFTGAAWYAGRQLAVVGRISMDSMAIAIDAAGPDMPAEGDFVELIGPSQDIRDVARGAGTIAYEILVRLGRRHQRIYRNSRRTPVASTQEVA